MRHAVIDAREKIERWVTSSGMTCNVVAGFLIICITVYVFVPDTSWKKFPTCFIAIRWVCFHGRILIVGKTGTKIVFFIQKVTFVHVMSLKFNLNTCSRSTTRFQPTFYIHKRKHSNTAKFCTIVHRFPA